MTDGPIASATTAELVAAARQQDRPAIEQLLIRHLPGLEAFVRLRMGARLRGLMTAPDLVQSVCREVLEDLTAFEFRGEAPFRHWLYVRAENKMRARHRYHRASKRNQENEVALPEPSQLAATYRGVCTPSQDLEARETMERVEAAFDQLPDDYREAVILHKLCGLSHKEIAERMQRSEGAVRNLVYRGISRLALLVDDDITASD